jgi:uncharacterized protein with HEPN domain
MIARLETYLRQMETAASDACDFVQGMDEAGFLADVRTQRAVGMSLVILGEVVARIARDYPELLSDHPDMAWNEMQGMRNRVAHGYFDDDPTIIWRTTQLSLPELLDNLHALRNWHAQGE